MPFNPGADEKHRALDDVRREIEELVRVLDRLQSATPEDRLLRDALLRSLLVHLRTLLPIFESGSRSVHYSGGIRQENDDVLAADYGFLPERFPIAREHRTWLHRGLRNLSYSRASATSPVSQGHALTLVVPVLRRCAAFADHILGSVELSPESRSEWTRLSEALQPFAGTRS